MLFEMDEEARTAGVGADLGPRHGAGLPVSLASDWAAGVTGCTLAVAGDTVTFVSAPPTGGHAVDRRRQRPDRRGAGRPAGRAAGGFETTRLTSGY